MQVHLLKSKINRATVTGGNVKYEGSLTIAIDLMEKAGLCPYEKILCGNMANGERFETYAIPGQRGSGQIIMNFATFDQAKAKKWKPRVIVLGKGNKIVDERGI
jgi:aspartate 1-decarboxylase